MKWAEARKIAVRVLGPMFQNLGYKNPGKTMWRYRDKFIDVVQLYVNKYGTSFSIDLGCHPRKDPNLKNNPKTWDTEFRGRMSERYDFSTITVEEFENVLIKNLEEIERQEAEFFEIFDDLENCLKVLNGELINPESVFLLPNVGSNSYLQKIALIENLILQNSNAPQHIE
jgi:hypothetical protein